jgi:hypothetical protein
MACSLRTRGLRGKLPLHTVALQTGMAPMNMLLIVVLVGFGVFLLLKIAPIWIESYAVSDAIFSLKEDFELRARSKHELYGLLLKRFQINDVKHITYTDIKKKVKIKRTGQFSTFTVNYDVVVPLFSNVSLLFDVHKEIEI